MIYHGGIRKKTQVEKELYRLHYVWLGTLGHVGTYIHIAAIHHTLKSIHCIDAICGYTSTVLNRCPAVI